jgi:hypothetical protein
MVTPEILKTFVWSLRGKDFATLTVSSWMHKSEMLHVPERLAKTYVARWVPLKQIGDLTISGRSFRFFHMAENCVRAGH